MTFIYSFSLQLDVPDITQELEDKLYEAGCSDATLSRRGREGDFNVMLTFDREATDLESAMQSAEADVKKTGIKVLWTDLPTGTYYVRKKGEPKKDWRKDLRK
jgi:hypothetical protein